MGQAVVRASTSANSYKRLTVLYRKRGIDYVYLGFHNYFTP